MGVSSYSKADAAEQKQKDMVNSGARGTKGRNLRTEVDCKSIVPMIYPTIFKYLVPVIYSAVTPGEFFASGSSLVLPRAAADTRGQYSSKHYAGASIARNAMQGQRRGAQERRRGGGTRERGTGRKRSLELLVVRQQELG
jgi:hypothetical protein